MLLVDIGANLGHESFRHDLDAVLARAQDAGVAHLLVTGASAEGSSAAQQIALAHPGLCSATAGLHPHHAADFNSEVEALFRDLLARPEVRACGEMGLDYFRDLAPRDVQIFAFEQQLGIAMDVQKPLFLHQRDAHDDFLAVLKNVRDRIAPCVVHCFTDERRALFDYLDQDWYIGVTGWICDERRGAHLKELVRHIPAGRLLIETDAPYLMPRDLQPKPSHRRNEPMYLAHICAEVARCRGESAEDCARQTTENARRLFRLPEWISDNKRVPD
jgi:TatD DNase family protein